MCKADNKDLSVTAEIRGKGSHCLSFCVTFSLLNCKAGSLLGNVLWVLTRIVATCHFFWGRTDGPVYLQFFWVTCEASLASTDWSLCILGNPGVLPIAPVFPAANL